MRVLCHSIYYRRNGHVACVLAKPFKSSLFVGDYYVVTDPNVTQHALANEGDDRRNVSCCAAKCDFRGNWHGAVYESRFLFLKYVETGTSGTQCIGDLCGVYGYWQTDYDDATALKRPRYSKVSSAVHFFS